jgi:hypothetical protein
MEVILLIVWLVGVIAATYPIYMSLNMAQKRLSNRRYVATYTESHAFWFTLLATGLALAWPLAAPFTISYLIYNKRLPNFEQVVDVTDTTFADKEAYRKQLNNARRQIEAVAHETEVEVNHFDHTLPVRRYQPPKLI